MFIYENGLGAFLCSLFKEITGLYIFTQVSDRTEQERGAGAFANASGSRLVSSGFVIMSVKLRPSRPVG